MQNKIDQTKFNAISAKILHRKAKNYYDNLNNLLLVLTLIVPLLFIIAQYVTIGTDYEILINTISFILSILLLAVSFLSLIYKVGDKILIHKMGLKNNIYIANECDNISKLSEKEQEWFFRYVTEMDNNDNDTFANISEKDKRNAYRDSLKEFQHGNYTIKCPHCNSSPWNYKPGDCQLCGNTKQTK